MSARRLLPQQDFDLPKALRYWLVWFGLGNSLAFYIIGISFLRDISIPNWSFLYQTLTGLFICLAFVGQFGLMAFLSSLCLLPLTFIYPKRSVLSLVAVVGYALLLLLLCIDAVVYKQYHFHLNGVIWSLWWSAEHKQIFDFTWLEVGWACLIFIVLLIFEVCCASFFWRNLFAIKYAWRMVAGFLSCLGISYLIFLLSNAQLVSPIGQQAQALPLYNRLLAGFLPMKNSFALLEEMGQANFQQTRQVVKPLRYPQRPLQCSGVKTPLNILLIVIDSWRFDMLNATVTPHLARFSEQASRYWQHYSGGNATGPGLFSLFYGLPYAYWTAMLEQQRGSLLLEQLQKSHYTVKLFASASLQQPNFKETIFKNVQAITKAPQGNVWQRDQWVTEQGINFLQTANNQQPFFVFLFYDAVHSYCDDGIPQQRFFPAAGVCNRLWLTAKTNPEIYRNRYQNSLWLVDQQLDKVFKKLAEKHWLKNTIVMVTSDHGQEFNDNGLGYWGHAGNFTRFQLQVPLLIYWPGKAKRDDYATTSHYQIVPLLMRHALACTNTSSDYAIEEDLWGNGRKSYLLASSYIDLGILEPDTITTVFANGEYLITDTHNNVLPHAKLSKGIIQQALMNLNQFFD